MTADRPAVPRDAPRLLAEFREADEKSRLLHEARSEAHAAMREACAWHEFIVGACRAADEDAAQARFRLERDAVRAAYQEVFHD